MYEILETVQARYDALGTSNLSVSPVREKANTPFIVYEEGYDNLFNTIECDVSLTKSSFTVNLWSHNLNDIEAIRGMIIEEVGLYPREKASCIVTNIQHMTENVTPDSHLYRAIFYINISN